MRAPRRPSPDGAQEAGAPGRRLGVLSLGFLTQPALRRILGGAGWSVRLGPPFCPADAIGVWGRRGPARRGIAVARWRDLPLVTVEDAFLRSVRPGRAEPPAGLLIDGDGVHYDPAHPSRIETLLTGPEVEDPETLVRAARARALLTHLGLSKYNAWEEAPGLPAPGFVLLLDQTAGDAAVTASAATRETFRAMLAAARAEHPGRAILIRTHPEVAAGRKSGHFGPEDAETDVTLDASPVPPAALLARAHAVYTVSSQTGFEAILAGHRPRVFGQPFYAGWDLSDDEAPPPRRGRPRTADQLFAAAMLLAPAWHDPALDRPSSFEEAALGLAARARAWREGQQPAIALGMRLWKRRTVAAFLEGEAPRPRFADDPDRALARAAEEGRRLVVWASAETPELAARAAARGVPLLRMEDGFLRSRGLGAALVPAASLVLDDLGIYFDPTRPSRLEALIEAAPALPEVARARAAALRTRLLETGVTKYNTGAAAPLPATGGRPVILVPGQVEDDASIRLGAGTVRTNLGLLEAAREANPGAFLVYKPHPDVEAGLRPGKIAAEDLARLADHVAEAADPAALLARADGLWTMTSLMGFEALLRGVPVTALGRPFYAGWGLTEDRTGLPDPFPRRRARPGLDGLVHATLIDYPRYRDPVSGLPCPPEVIVERLATGAAPRQGPALRLLARAQGLLASYATLWR